MQKLQIAKTLFALQTPAIKNPIKSRFFTGLPIAMFNPVTVQIGVGNERYRNETRHPRLKISGRIFRCAIEGISRVDANPQKIGERPTCPHASPIRSIGRVGIFPAETPRSNLGALLKSESDEPDRCHANSNPLARCGHPRRRPGRRPPNRSLNLGPLAKFHEKFSPQNPQLMKCCSVI